MNLSVSGILQFLPFLWPVYYHSLTRFNKLIKKLICQIFRDNIDQNPTRQSNIQGAPVVYIALKIFVYSCQMCQDYCHFIFIMEISSSVSVLNDMIQKR